MTQAPTPTAETVRELVRSLLPGEGPVEVAPAAESPGHRTWWVGTRHVLRLATDRDASARQRRELRLRALVRQHTQIAIPSGVAHGEWAAGLAYTLDARLPGTAAEGPAVSALGEADLATLLTGLREVPVRQAESAGVPRVPPRSLPALRAAAASRAGALAGDEEFDPGRLAQLTATVAAQLAAQPGAAVLVHHGLGGDHLVMSGDGRVRGILGWSEAVVGDPAEDIACLAASVGAPAAVRAATLAGYGARPCLRGLWLARCDTLARLADALEGRDPTPQPVLRARLHRAWEAILLERITELPDDEAP
ncbi:aminoglycoside phosphotransferase family protein [Streptomyces sp. NPDC052040]|uniref:aminoglycoside phosphotransferase family protein n=1 Tax=Streptomyces sp. NPDC052040 TaxID=3365682 RepID=UPI0037D12103